MQSKIPGLEKPLSAISNVSAQAWKMELCRAKSGDRSDI